MARAECGRRRNRAPGPPPGSSRQDRDRRAPCPSPCRQTGRPGPTGTPDPIRATRALRRDRGRPRGPPRSGPCRDEALGVAAEAREEVAAHFHVEPSRRRCGRRGGAGSRGCLTALCRQVSGVPHGQGVDEAGRQERETKGCEWCLHAGFDGPAAGAVRSSGTSGGFRQSSGGCLCHERRPPESRVDQTGASWNPLISWLRQIDALWTVA